MRPACCSGINGSRKLTADNGKSSLGAPSSTFTKPIVLFVLTAGTGRALRITDRAPISCKFGKSGNATCLTVRALARGGKRRRYHGQNLPRVLISVTPRRRFRIESWDCHVQVWPPAPDFAASSRRACVSPFLRLDLIFREPYLAEAVTSLNVDIEGHHYSCGPQVTA